MTMKKTNASALSCLAIRTPVLAALATICLAAAVTTVRAADVPSDSVPMKTVTYLNGRSFVEKQQFSTCNRQSIARAVAAVDQPALTALQAIKTGRPDGTAKLAKR
jgi:hypothetical protein